MKLRGTGPAHCHPGNQKRYATKGLRIAHRIPPPESGPGQSSRKGFPQWVTCHCPGCGSDPGPHLQFSSGQGRTRPRLCDTSGLPPSDQREAGSGRRSPSPPQGSTRLVFTPTPLCPVSGSHFLPPACHLPGRRVASSLAPPCSPHAVDHAQPMRLTSSGHTSPDSSNRRQKLAGAWPRLPETTWASVVWAGLRGLRALSRGLVVLIACPPGCPNGPHIGSFLGLWTEEPPSISGQARQTSI